MMSCSADQTTHISCHISSSAHSFLFSYWHIYIRMCYLRYLTQLHFPLPLQPVLQPSTTPASPFYPNPGWYIWPNIISVASGACPILYGLSTLIQWKAGTCVFLRTLEISMDASARAGKSQNRAALPDAFMEGQESLRTELFHYM